MSILIAICGGSCSGKTTLAAHLESKLGDDCLLLSQDDYYFGIEHMEFEGRLPNFDHPNAIDYPRLIEDTKTLKLGQTISPPKYDWVNHKSTESGISLAPKPIIILEGMLMLVNESLRDVYDYRHYIECPENLRLERRLKRDTKERGREKDEIIWQFENHVAPSHWEFVYPSRLHADHIITQEEYMVDMNSLSERMIAKWPN